MREKTGKKKTYYVSDISDEMVRNYSERLGISQSQIVQELMQIGVKAFEAKYGIGSEEDKGKKDEDEDDLSTREGRERAFEKARKKKWHDIVHDYEGSESYGWQPV